MWRFLWGKSICDASLTIWRPLVTMTGCFIWLKGEHRIYFATLMNRAPTCVCQLCVHSWLCSRQLTRSSKSLLEGLSILLACWYTPKMQWHTSKKRATWSTGLRKQYDIPAWSSKERWHPSFNGVLKAFVVHFDIPFSPPEAFNLISSYVPRILKNYLKIVNSLFIFNFLI